jgi:negative regulator of sigma E activity
LNGPILFERESQRVYTTWQMVRLYNKTLFAWNAAIQQMTAETTVMVSVFWDVQKANQIYHSSLNIIPINN